MRRVRIAAVRLGIIWNNTLPPTRYNAQFQGHGTATTTITEFTLHNQRHRLLPQSLLLTTVCVTQHKSPWTSHRQRMARQRQNTSKVPETCVSLTLLQATATPLTVNSWRSRKPTSFKRLSIPLAWPSKQYFRIHTVNPARRPDHPYLALPVLDPSMHLSRPLHVYITCSVKKAIIIMVN